MPEKPLYFNNDDNNNSEKTQRQTTEKECFEQPQRSL